MNRVTQEICDSVRGSDAAERARLVREIPQERRAEYLRVAYLTVIAPSMMQDSVPSVAANVAYHALCDHVDWHAVAEFMATVPEEN